MKTQISVNNAKLSITKEKVANLSDADMNLILGGDEAPGAGGGSTRHNFTCDWCTSTTSIDEGVN